MGRRKKVPLIVHREAITLAASKLFIEKGITSTSMDDIAKAAGYSKATIYVYFKNKEELVSILTLKSMEKLYHSIASVLEEPNKSTKEKYHLICQGLVQYQETFPFYFQIALDTIPFKKPSSFPEEHETYKVGEKINEKLKIFLLEGIKKGDLKKNLQLMPTIFNFWGMLSGTIGLAANKEVYIKETMNLSKTQFLEYGFELLYTSISN